MAGGMHGRGHAWQKVCEWQGACMVVVVGHAWQGVCMVGASMTGEHAVDPVQRR